MGSTWDSKIHRYRANYFYWSSHFGDLSLSRTSKCTATFFALYPRSFNFYLFSLIYSSRMRLYHLRISFSISQQRQRFRPIYRIPHCCYSSCRTAIDPQQCHPSYEFPGSTMVAHIWCSLSSGIVVRPSYPQALGLYLFPVLYQNPFFLFHLVDISYTRVTIWFPSPTTNRTLSGLRRTALGVGGVYLNLGDNVIYYWLSTNVSFRICFIVFDTYTSAFYYFSSLISIILHWLDISLWHS